MGLGEYFKEVLFIAVIMFSNLYTPMRAQPALFLVWGASLEL